MSQRIETGGPAFPQHGWSNDPATIERMAQQGGMSLRAWLAGQSMPVIAHRMQQLNRNWTAEEIGKIAIEIADAVLKELSGEPSIDPRSAEADAVTLDLFEALKNLLAVIQADDLISESVSYMREARAAIARIYGKAATQFRVGQKVRVKNSGHKFEIDSITETIAGKTVYEFDGQIWKPEEIEAVTA